jgi:sporulation-control protein spo0M
VLPVNRYAWEKKRSLFSRRGERRRSVLHFNRVLGVRSSGINQAKGDTVLSLLAIEFAPSEAPAGTIELTFAGGGAMALDVEVIEIQLADVGGAWEAAARPRHGV